MKDYYYFLGVKPNSSSDEIKKAYRKLSLKYHPDKNENDEFFADRFREIQEAYEALSDTESRRIYNQKFNHFQRSQKSTLPPKIKNFHANKTRAEKGEEITVYWQTYDADLVKITPFGLEKAQGERKFRITEFDKTGKFQIILHATNTFLHKSVAHGITITEISKENPQPKQHEFSSSFENKQRIENQTFQLNWKWWIFISLIVLTALAYYFLRNKLTSIIYIF